MGGLWGCPILGSSKMLPCILARHWPTPGSESSQTCRALPAFTIMSDLAYEHNSSSNSRSHHDGVFSPLHLVAFAQNGAHCDVEPAVITHVPSKEKRSTSAGRMVIKGTSRTDQVGYAPPGLPSTSLCTTLREWQTFQSGRFRDRKVTACASTQADMTSIRCS